MFKVIYDEDEESCTLECPRCGSHESPMSASVVIQDGRVSTYPDAKTVLVSHFNDDPNSGIPVCPAMRLTPGETSWQAVNSNGAELARGRVVIKQIGNAIQSPEIVQDEPGK